MSSQEAQSVPDPTPASCTFDELIAMAEEQYALYQQNPDTGTFNLAIHHYHAAFDLGPSPDTKADYLLAFFRFHHIVLSSAQAQGGDDTIAMRYIDKVLEFTSLTHPLRPVVLGLQATSYSQRYSRAGDIADLHSAVQIFKTAVDTIQADNPQRLYLLIQYGCQLYTRFLALNDEEDLDLAIQQFGTVLEGCSDSEPMLTTAQRLLACALDSRYKLRYNIDDIDRAVEAWATVVDKLQQQPLEYLIACVGYATVLHTRHGRKANIDDLHVALRYFEIVITRCPPGHKYYSTISAYYATLLINRWEQEDSIGDIDKAIEYICRALTAGVETSSRLELVSIHGYCQIARFLHFGSATDLDSAVEKCYAAVSPDPSLDAGVLSANLSRLAFALFTRYQLQGDTTDATHAKMYLEQARELCPSGHRNRPNILHSYARILGNLARKNSDLPDLERSIEYFYESLEACYALARSNILRDLAIAYLHRYALRQVGNPSDVDIAFSLSKTSVELQPENYPHRGITLLFHAKTVVAMHSRKNSITNTEIALGILHEAREAFTPGHPVLIEMYREFSKVHFIRHSITNEGADLEEAFKYRIAAAQHSGGGSQLQLETAMTWIDEAEKYNHPSLLDAYKSAIRILDLHLVLKPSLGLRHDIIKSQARSICVDATSCALRLQDVVGAVEVFEHSRGLFWTFLARLRTPLDELRVSGPAGRALADEFETLGRQLETPMTLGDDGEYGQRYRRIQRDWNAVVDKIRSTDGFDKFLLPPSYKDLRAAAIGGPVIILNASRHSCDAVIVLADEDPIHIAFEQTMFSRITHMSSDFEEVLCSLRQYVKQSDERRLAKLLRDLWTYVVSKVVDKLEARVPKDSRIWWCPTGAFTSLPIHAANPYRKGEHGLSDLYVSSYTPTLSALIRSRNKRDTQQNVPSFVCIGQPNSAGYDLLKTVGQELDTLRQLLPESVQFTRLSDETATREAALAALRTNTFAHLACHGQQVPEKPFDSHFAMRDGHVTLLDIIHNSSGQEPEFAFLSACKTATGDADAPDEVIHLAAALQFAGVRNVVGTMWSVDDQIVIHIVAAFYRAMVREDGVFDPSRAARALRVATKTNRVPLDQRIVFIHIGI